MKFLNGTLKLIHLRFIIFAEAANNVSIKVLNVSAEAASAETFNTDKAVPITTFIIACISKKG